MSKLITAILLGCVLSLLGTGCTVTRTVRITVDPPDAKIHIAGSAPVNAPVTEQFVFDSPYKSYTITAVRLGYKDEQQFLRADDDKSEIVFKLKPEKRTLYIYSEPAAIISVDGNPIDDKEVIALNYEAEMGVDPKTNEPIVHEISASRANFQTDRVKVSRADVSAIVKLKPKPLTKPITVTTEPPGATIHVDELVLGKSPLQNVAVEFPYDITQKEFQTRRLWAELPGYDTKVEEELKWETAESPHVFKFSPKSKMVRITTDPDDAQVFIGKDEISSPTLGRATKLLEFPPINAKGDSTTYTAVISKKTADAEWETKTLPIGWDDGQTDYRVTLTQVRSRPVQMLMSNFKRIDTGWEMTPEWVAARAMTDTAEPAGMPAPKMIYTAPKGVQLGSVAISPDGSQLLFTTLSATPGQNDFRSKINVVKSDGSAPPRALTTGTSLDLMPTFTPDGEQIVFSSNRGGKRFGIWRMPATGAGAATQLTNGDTANDLWPMIDSDPRPHLFYQTMIDARPDPRIYMVQLGNSFPTDLTAGSNPRVSPRNDSVLFCAVNEATNTRDIFRINLNDRNAAAINLTNTSADDEHNVSWSRDGSKIVFASNRGTDNFDIWMIDLSKPNQPMQITANGSHDDSPVFDLTGSNVYFRSNRGGDWGIWKIAVPKG